MSEKYIKVKMPDGFYFVPAKLVAEDRAKYYAANDNVASKGKPEYKKNFDKTFKEEYDYTLGDDDEILDWAANNMDWKEVKHAALKEPTKEEISERARQECWMNGNKEIIKK